MPRVAIYARYSSALQDSRSIDDQVAICRERAEREGWTVVDIFADYAISGAVRDRPSLNAMLARLNEFDIILAEALDRISRHQVDSPAIFEALQFHSTRLITLSEGEINELHIGLKGTMAALFRKDLADKIRRGQRGRIAAGRIPGGLAYGYRKVAALNAKGEAEGGIREIDPEQAEVIRRIFRELRMGESARAIAARLNRDDIPAPRGRLWTVSMINGDRVRRNGIVHNEIYIGTIVYNRTTMMRDPSTRKRVPKMNPESEWLRHDAPELRIVDQADWDAVHERKQQMTGWGYRAQKRPKRLLSGLVRCGCCGGQYIIVKTDGWGCADARRGGTCTNRNMISTARLESRVLQGLRDQLLAPDIVRAHVRKYHELHAREQANARQESERLTRRLAEAERKIERLVIAIEAGAGIEEVQAALMKAREDKREAADRLAQVEALPVIALHPHIAEEYRRNVESLTGAMLDEDEDARMIAMPAIRALIDSIKATPREGGGVDLELTGKLAQALALASGQMPSSTVVPNGMLLMVAEDRSLLEHTIATVRI